MKLVQLFSAYKTFKAGDDLTKEISGLSINAQELKEGQVFFAVRGARRDGHDFLKEAASKGAAGLVVEDGSRVPSDFRGAVLVVPNTREALMKLSARYFDYPAEQLFCVGVTGTNGKTSTVYMIEAILNRFGLKTGVMGTINHHLGETTWESGLTTPDAITLNRRLRDFLALGAKAAAFEVSSHAIDQGRVSGIPFSCVVFTNLTRDHLDYHQTMEAYFSAKEKLFRELPMLNPHHPVDAIININDEWGRRIEVSPQVRKWTYGEAQADFQFQIHEVSYAGTRFRLSTPKGDMDVRLPLPGRHNVYNAVAAIAAGVVAGASLETCVEAIGGFQGVPGRLQRVPGRQDLHVFVDYAHTDDALRTVLTILQQIRSQTRARSKICTVFGCGGDRDRGKRPLMARAAVELSDIVYVTSDNPRTEDPMAIIQEILVGVPKELMNSKVFVEVDRKEAIRKSITRAGSRDVVLIAGKGHETDQIIGSEKHAFNDFEVAREILSGL